MFRMVALFSLPANLVTYFLVTRYQDGFAKQFNIQLRGMNLPRVFTSLSLLHLLMYGSIALYFNNKFRKREDELIRKYFGHLDDYSV